LKEEALDRTMWRNRFGRGFGPVVRQNIEWMTESNFTKNRPMGANCSMRTDVRRDGQTDTIKTLIVAFHNFANALKIIRYLIQIEPVAQFIFIPSDCFIRISAAWSRSQPRFRFGEVTGQHSYSYVAQFLGTWQCLHFISWKIYFGVSICVTCDCYLGSLSSGLCL
jgi:hypothetical protein